MHFCARVCVCVRVTRYTRNPSSPQQHPHNPCRHKRHPQRTRSRHYPICNDSCLQKEETKRLKTKPPAPLPSPVLLGLCVVFVRQWDRPCAQAQLHEHPGSGYPRDADGLGLWRWAARVYQPEPIAPGRDLWVLARGGEETCAQDRLEDYPYLGVVLWRVYSE